MKKQPKEETATEVFWDTILTALKIVVTLFAIFTVLSLVSINPDTPVTQFNYPQADN